MSSGKKNTYSDNLSIFKFIDANKNDELSKMKGIDLQNLLVLLDDYFLELRNNLGIGNSITFGIELEVENTNYPKLGQKLENLCLSPEWILKSDSSLHRGAEINSPILRDKTKSWNELEKVCKIVKPMASIGFNSGGHIHIGTQTLGNKEESWLNFIKLWSVYENIIFRFVYGEFLTARNSLKKFAEPISEKLWTSYSKLKNAEFSLDEIIYRISSDRRNAVNFDNVVANIGYYPGNTIEFRCPNGTLSSMIWQNNINFLVKLLLYCKSTYFNDDIVEERHRLNSDKFIGLEWYNEIYLNQALELCDMIFSNNLDKINFLKQYFKNFETHKSGFDKAKTLIKK